MHYAAKNNAAASLKVMLRLGARINDRDYKRRTPLFVAAETGKLEYNFSEVFKSTFSCQAKTFLIKIYFHK